MYHTKVRILVTAWALLAMMCSSHANSGSIPLPEHPRPDFERPLWLNLNGKWSFRFDSLDAGEKESWFTSTPGFDKQIMVPFPWGSALSGLENEADIGWYSRIIEVPANWDGSRVFIIVGASDWITKIWLDGNYLGMNQGGYTPFEFELTPFIKKGLKQRLTIRVDDTPKPYKLEGKQGYGEAKGIWQTLYLEARGENYLTAIHFTPDIDKQSVKASGRLALPVAVSSQISIRFLNAGEQNRNAVIELKKGQQDFSFEIPMPGMRLWTLNDPYLYETEVSLQCEGISKDRVGSYFGMRKISIMPLPLLGHPYVALNNEPVYLQMTLDQSYHQGGFYTFPTDEFMRDEILRSKRIGLNCNRVHIKCEVPRKLYWADKLGLLIMADVPNWWGEPVPEAFAEWEKAMREMIHRDFNHPSIFQWVLFNETWGLFSKDGGGKNIYLPETQQRVADLYALVKKIDPTRLVEDQSPCNNDHVATDVNSWHAYLPGYKWKEDLDRICANTFPGSAWNFTGGRVQDSQPLYNSECGNVWGYEGSTGDVDWSWDYHLMMNEFRSHPQVCGWLYTEHHDVINEWNGYYRFDRSEKITGLEGLVPGMTLNDLHSDVYLAPQGMLCQPAAESALLSVPLFLSCMTGRDLGQSLTIRSVVYFRDRLGNSFDMEGPSIQIPYNPWKNEALTFPGIRMPDEAGLAIVAFFVEDAGGNEIHRNFITYLVGEDSSPAFETVTHGQKKMQVVRFSPASFSKAEWTQKQWNIADNQKVNGAGSGFFEYEVMLPEGIDTSSVEAVTLVAELSAKQLFGKDKAGPVAAGGDYMRGEGIHDPGLNPNAYPMTDQLRFPTRVRIVINGVVTGVYDLTDDPADHRGILSWYAQHRNNRLSEAGSYGYLVRSQIPLKLLQNQKNKVTIRFEADESLAGGLAIYGEGFGSYPVEPSMVFTLK